MNSYDWSANYLALRQATNTTFPGYLSHEAVTWHPGTSLCMHIIYCNAQFHLVCMFGLIVTTNTTLLVVLATCCMHTGLRKWLFLPRKASNITPYEEAKGNQRLFLHLDEGGMSLMMLELSLNATL